MALLASSLLLTIGRGATLPFMTIYLNRQYGLGVDLIGYALTSALTIGVIFSLGFGILADKFDKSATCYSRLSPSPADLSPSQWCIMSYWLSCFLRLLTAPIRFSTVLKAGSPIISPRQQKHGFFAQLYRTQYRLDGWPATRHAAGDAKHQFTLLACRYLFRISAGLYSGMGDTFGCRQRGKNATIWSPSVLLRDKALLWFTLSAFLASFVGAPLRPVFHSTLWSLPIAASPEKVVAVVLPVNAVIVVSLQYAVGRRLTAVNIRPMMTTGTVFIAGLIGFIFQATICFWGFQRQYSRLAKLFMPPANIC